MATLTMQEILSQVTGIDEIEIERGNEVQIIRPSEVYEAMTKWAEQIWKDNKQLTAEDVVFTIVEQWGNALFQGVEGGKKLVNKYTNQQTQELQNQINELQQWKQEQIDTFLPLMEFMHKRTELQAGESITKKAIQYIEERDGLNAICKKSINLLNRIITIHRVGETFESQAKTLINKYNEEFGR